MPGMSVARFYDELADDYHLIYSDWDASIRRQGAALDALIGRAGADVLDCACGIGTQAIGLALRGHRVTGTDISPRAAARAAREAARRSLRLRTAAADMRHLPFADGRFDAVVCADNSLPHLLTGQEVRAALAEMRRVLRPGGLLLVSTRPYDELVRERPASTPRRSTGSPRATAAARSGPSLSSSGTGTTTASATTWSTSSSFRRAASGVSRFGGPPTGRSPEPVGRLRGRGGVRRLRVAVAAGDRLLPAPAGGPRRRVGGPPGAGSTPEEGSTPPAASPRRSTGRGPGPVPRTSGIGRRLRAGACAPASR